MKMRNMGGKEKFRGKYRTESVRLEGWDYSSDGGYFLTICTKDREEYFGKIENYNMEKTVLGEIAEKFWLEIPKQFKHATLDEWVLMPNHIHGIVIINKPNKSPRRNAINRVSTGGITGKSNPMLNPFSLSKIIRWFKGRTTFEIHKNINHNFAWQPRYYDRVIRNENELNRIRKYIFDNPEKWDLDKNNQNNFT